MIPRLARWASFSAVLALLFILGRCSARDDGAAVERAKGLERAARRHADAASLWKDSAEREKRRGDSLERRSALGRVRYRTLRDTLTLTDTVQVVRVLDAADSLVAYQDSVIASQKRRIGFLELTITEKDQQITAIQKQLALDAKRIKAAKRDGLLLGVGAAAFVAVGAIASH